MIFFFAKKKKPHHTRVARVMRLVSLMELIQHVKLIILRSTHKLLCKVTFDVTLSNIKLLNIFN